MSNNLFSFSLPEPDYFTKKQMDDYFNKIKSVNPSIPINDAVKLSMNMLENFHNLMSQIIFYYPETELQIEIIHREGHVFRIRMPDNSPGKNKGIVAISLSINGFNNNDIVNRHNNFDYVISCVLIDVNNNVILCPEFGYNPTKMINDKDLKTNIKMVFEEIDKIVCQTQISTRKEQISKMVDHALSLEPYTNFSKN